MSTHLPILQIIIPLIMAPVCLLLKRGTLCHLWSVLASWLAFAVALMLLMQVMDGQVISYELGGWAAPWGIEYRIDYLNALLLIIVTAMGAVVVPFMGHSIHKEIPEERQYLFYLMYLLCLSGTLGISVTGDAFNLFVFLEISSLSTYVMISLGKRKEALIAAFRYLVLGTIGATFYVIGIGLLYASTGTLNMADLAVLVMDVEESSTVKAGLAFIVVGLSLKIALFPLHNWLPGAYAEAPSAVSAFLASTATKVAIYALVRMHFGILGVLVPVHQDTIQIMWMVLAVGAIFIGSFVALSQDNLKRLLAWSSISQVGYMVLGFSLISTAGVASGLVHLFNHALVKAALFLVVGCMVWRFGSYRLQDLAGMGRSMPLTAAAFIGAGLSLIGVPLTVGFVSKWYLATALLEQGFWPLVAVVVISSLLAVLYIWRVVEVLWFVPIAVKQDATPAEAPLSMLIPCWLLIVAALYFGINGTDVYDIAYKAAQSLPGIRP